MDYKEKYEMALETIQEILDSGSDSIKMSRLRLRLQSVFPELKEGEDEEIKKWLIGYFHQYKEDGMEKYANGLKVESIIAWLKKQGQQDMIPLDKVIKFLDEQLVNDKDEVTGEPFINFQNYGAFKETFISFFKRKMLEKQSEQKTTVEMKTPEESLGIDSDTYNKIVDECIYGEQKSQRMISAESKEAMYNKPADTVKPKFKVGDTMRTKQEATDNITSGLPVVVSIDDEYYHCTNELIAIKDQGDYEYPPINKKHNAWSEEDTFKVQRICKYLDEAKKYYADITEVRDCIDWLKSLKQKIGG